MGKGIQFETHFCDKWGLHSQISFMFRYFPLLFSLYISFVAVFLCFPMCMCCVLCVRCLCMYHFMFVFSFFCIFRGFYRNSLFNKTLCFAIFLYERCFYGVPNMLSCIPFHLRLIFFHFVGYFFSHSQSISNHSSAQTHTQRMNGFIKGKIRTQYNGLLEYLA